jgi:Protein of unknown function (DUF2950)
MMWLMRFKQRGRGSRPVAGFFTVLVLCASLAGAQAALNSNKTQMPGAAAANTAPQPPAKGQEMFPTAELAVRGLIAALQDDDNAARDKILGPDAEKILSSGDPAEDQKNRLQFLAKYAQMHRLLTEPDGLTTLYIGAENWPTPIPLAREGKKWYFDTPAGEQEIVYRRVGQNELMVIQVCDELVQAEKEYYASPQDGNGQQYAAHFISTPGQHNGLFWQASAGQPQSPLGPLVAQASQQGYAAGSSPRRTPFYGYYFRLLKAQGPTAPGGAKSYVVDGKMTGGFAFVAYPAQYRSSGVMTFIVGPDGVVYQKNLGPQTAELAPKIDAYQVDSTWQKAD